MKKVLLLSVAMMLVASLAFAQGGSIGIFADAGGTNCGILDNIPGLVTAYFVHVLTPCATASQWAAPIPACNFMAFLSQTAVFPVTIGNFQSGVAIGYGSAQVGPVHILSASFFAQALTGSCCLWSVVADPLAVSGQIEVVDCASTLIFATGGSAIINPDPTCNCDVANYDATWGKVKALYE